MKRYEELKEYLDSAPRDVQSYGLVHQDAHAGNLFVDQRGRITLFDFDDCTYSWYLNDISIVLFYTLVGRNDAADFIPIFMAPFLEGYIEENDLDPDYLTDILKFLKLREIDLYAVIHRSFDVDNLQDQWVANFMENRKYRIENNIPFVDFDFDRLGDLLA